MLIHLIVVLIVLGAALYIANLLPIDPTIKRILQVIAIAVVVVWLLQTFAPSI